MVHWAREVAQFAKLRKETHGFTEAICGLWLNYKQTKSPQRYRKGQVEYFAKRGMSLLCFVLVRRVRKVNSDDKEIIGLTYNCYDVIIKQYSDQNHVQVLGLLDAIPHKIEHNFAKSRKLCLEVTIHHV